MTKLILLIQIALLLISCKTKQVQCDSYTTIQFIEHDTLCIESEHIHIDEEYLCGYFDDIEIIVSDTLEITIIINKFNESLFTSTYHNSNYCSNFKFINRFGQREPNKK